MGITKKSDIIKEYIVILAVNGMIKKWMRTVIILAMAAFVCSFSVSAVEESSYSYSSEAASYPSELSYQSESSPEEISGYFSQPSEYSNEEKSSPDEYSYIYESSSEENSGENSSESSLLLEYTVSGGESSVSSHAEGSKEESQVSVADPFDSLRAKQYILPGDDPDYETKKNSSQPEKKKSQIKQNGLMNAPLPVSRADNNTNMYREEEDTAFVVGVIFWSVIGLAAAVLVILILSLKGGGDLSFTRKRYYKHSSYKPMRINGKKYKYRGR